MNNYKSATLTLPRDISTILTRTEAGLLDLIVDLSRNQAKRSPSGAYYAYPGEKWLAWKTGRSREWVSKSVNRLQTMGLLMITRRRKEKGRWRTNLYRLGVVLWRTLNGASAWFRSYIHHVNSGSHIVRDRLLVKRNEGLKQAFNEPGAGLTLEEIFSRIEKRFQKGG